MEEKSLNEKEIEINAEKPQGQEKSNTEETPVGFQLDPSLVLTELTLEQLHPIAKQLAQTTDYATTGQLYGDLTKRFRELSSIAEQEAKTLYEQGNQAAEDPAEGFVFAPPAIFQEIRTSFKEYKKNRENFRNEQTKIRQDNLKAKKEVLEQLKALSETPIDKILSSNIKPLIDTWKKVGKVPQEAQNELGLNFKAYVSAYYSKKNQAIELRDYDRSRNLEAKLKICLEVEALADQENILDAIAKLTRYHADFKALGQVPREHKEEIWVRFKAATDKIFEKRRLFADQFKEQLKDNLAQKQVICQKLDEFTTYQSSTIDNWEAKTKEIFALQKEWEAIGPVPKEVAKSVNKLFWNSFKTFFSNKNEFFTQLEKKRYENLALKQALVDRALELSQGDQSQKATDEVKKIQQDWKKIGPVPKDKRDSIYELFKKHCDAYFDKKRNRKDAEEKALEDNFLLKDAICKLLQESIENKTITAEGLADFEQKFAQIGQVPSAKQGNITDQFIQLATQAVDLFDLTDDAKEQLKFEKSIAFIKDSPNAEAKLVKREQSYKKRIQQVENDIALWQNNIEFFAGSKNADKLRAEFAQKIKDAHLEVKDIKEKLDRLQMYRSK